jgi:hypothetical protein
VKGADFLDEDEKRALVGVGLTGAEGKNVKKKSNAQGLIQESKQQATTHYIWRTRGDDKVRASHAANNGKTFSTSNPPPTGNPGEEFGCRCWAEPIGNEEYVEQVLISSVNDNPKKWSNVDFLNHYRDPNNTDVTLSQVGYLQYVIDHFAYEVRTSDGSRGGYQAVNKQIIDEAKKVIEGAVTYGFENTYPFGDIWDLLLERGEFSLGDSTIEGRFSGDVRKKGDYLVINGVVEYNYIDEFTDPTSKVERLMEKEKISREEAIERLGGETDDYGKPYDITDSWQTKFNATVKLPK